MVSAWVRSVNRFVEAAPPSESERGWGPASIGKSLTIDLRSKPDGRWRASARGKSELRRAVRRVTPGQGNLKDSGTENIPPEKGDGDIFPEDENIPVPFFG